MPDQLNITQSRRSSSEAAIIHIAQLFVCLVWVFVGLYIWIPMLVRYTFALITVLFASALAQSPLKGLKFFNKKVMSFYITGFKCILTCSDDEGDVIGLDEKSVISGLWEMTLATIMWVAGFFTVHWAIQGLPDFANSPIEKNVSSEVVQSFDVSKKTCGIFGNSCKYDVVYRVDNMKFTSSASSSKKILASFTICKVGLPLYENKVEKLNYVDSSGLSVSWPNFKLPQLLMDECKTIAVKSKKGSAWESINFSNGRVSFLTQRTYHKIKIPA